jgi:hypothetical protein
MKFILVPILIALVLTQVFSKWLVVMEYNLNKDFIAKNLCVNRAKPKMHCNGKCQMMKRLAEEEKQNSDENNSSSKTKIQDIVLSDKFFKPALPALLQAKAVYNEEKPLSKYSSPFASIFHPPALA